MAMASVVVSADYCRFQSSLQRFCGHKIGSYIHFYVPSFFNKLFFVLFRISNAGIFEVSQLFLLFWVMELPGAKMIYLSEAVIFSASTMFQTGGGGGEMEESFCDPTTHAYDSPTRHRMMEDGAEGERDESVLLIPPPTEAAKASVR
ncbi:unnamed protein product [Taenia asiatica]|uniref:Uncharacterized protein n=1 Tax=Taenia asiatica TaxID=60517 RepID=A0A0R3W389_TAEAS|nr:unnamed protein product [Taenia asiatica]